MKSFTGHWSLSFVPAISRYQKTNLDSFLRASYLKNAIRDVKISTLLERQNSLEYVITKSCMIPIRDPLEYQNKQFGDKLHKKHAFKLF